VILGDNIIVANGYGIFVENDSNSNSYKNVITGNKLELLAITPSNLEYKQKNDLKIKDIITKDESNDKYDYNVKSYGGDVYITIQGEKIELREALLQDKINMNDIIDGAKKDTQNGAIKSEIYKDGGSTIYKYKDYAILKCNRLDGNKDVYIGMPTMDINDILF
jgi:ACT domain-containing protein